MLGMSVVTYAFNLVAARWLVPEEFGALTALLSIILISNVVALGIQAAIARQIATQPLQAQAIIKTTSRVAIAIALIIGVAVAMSSLVFTPLLNLDSYWPVVFCGVMMVPLTIMGPTVIDLSRKRNWSAHWRPNRHGHRTNRNRRHDGLGNRRLVAGSRRNRPLAIALNSSEGKSQATRGGGVHSFARAFRLFHLK